MTNVPCEHRFVPSRILAKPRYRLSRPAQRIDRLKAILMIQMSVHLDTVNVVMVVLHARHRLASWRFS